MFASGKGWFVSRCSIHDFDLRALDIATKGRWIVLGARLECGPFFVRSFSFVLIFDKTSSSLPKTNDSGMLKRILY